MRQLSKDLVLERAKASKEVRDLLEEIYPEYFDKHFDLSELADKVIIRSRELEKLGEIVESNLIHFMHIRDSGKYKDKGFYLPGYDLDWELVREAFGNYVLVPKRK